MAREAIARNDGMLVLELEEMLHQRGLTLLQCWPGCDPCFHHTARCVAILLLLIIYFYSIITAKEPSGVNLWRFFLYYVQFWEVCL